MGFFSEVGVNIVSNLIETIGSKLIKEICDLYGYKSELEALEKTIINMKAVLADAEAKSDLSMEQQGYISELKAAVYDADDLFDEIFTRAKLKEIDADGTMDLDNPPLKKRLRTFLSSTKDEVSLAMQMSSRVKEIRKQLDTIANDHNKFDLSINYKPIVRRREDTCSYVVVKDIIGRDSDKKAILDVLLDPSATDDFCFLSIVGVGGLGKTTLAQLVYQHIKNIQNGFLSLWVCVGDQDGGQFDVKTILCKILELVTDKLASDDPSMEDVTKKFQEQFRGIKYFLVLDDLWNEDRRKWTELEIFLRMGQRGSKIVVTTRSEKTASSIGSKHVHKLKGLSEEDSWSLFEMTAFGEGEKDEELVEIGENIVKKCCNIPLAIKVIGSLLHGQERSKWESIEKSGLGEIKEGSDHILHTLKLSYYNLTPSLKSCFSYCAIFSKDEEMNKQMLIDLWLAQGYILPLDGGQSLDDAAEEYFLILLRRCFFEEVVKNEYGDVESVKMHDLIHDIAQEVSKEEICVVNSETKNVGEKVRHLMIDDSKYDQKHLTCSIKIRSYISLKGMADKEVENMTALRTLQVLSDSVERLISSWHKLLLLRYVYLRDDELLALPDSFTRLYNLQTLILKCWNLEKLPKDFGNLINLRHFDISECDKLMGMPLGMDKCTNLRILPVFVAGPGNSNAKLNVLQFLNKIKGRIDIKIKRNYEHVDEVSDTEGGYLKDMKHLTMLNIEFEGECINPEGLMKNLQPPSNLKSFKLKGYEGKTIQWFAISPQHHLVRIEFRKCHELEQIAVLSKLPHLKSLILDFLYRIEYMEEGMSNSSGDTKKVVDFFPSLESLHIRNVNLKGWWKEGGTRMRFPRLSCLYMNNCYNFTSFVPYLSPDNLPEHQCPSLCTLYIKNCPELASNLVCPSLEKLDLENINERLLITCENYQVDVTKSRGISISEKVSHLKSLRITGVTILTLRDCRDSEEESFVELKEELNQICASSLQTLNIEYCYHLKRLSGLESLRALQELSLHYNRNLSINEDDEEPWKSFHSLRKVIFGNILEMKSLPKGMQHMTSLQYLELYYCRYLERLPQWMSCLASLQFLNIYECPGIESFPEAMKDLTSLNTLSIKGCNLSINEDDEPWKSFHSLRNFTFSSKMKSLPKGMQHLTSLQSLHLIECENLEELPQWMSCLSSLQSLAIHYCEGITTFPEAMKDLTSLNTLSIKCGYSLEIICKNPDGEDFHKIKHIPNISIKW